MNPRRIVNIVNFIRYDEPRNSALDLLEPVVEQMRLLKPAGLPTTWLLQFDALVAGPYVPFLKAELPPGDEVGLWFEINRLHCEAAGVPFHGRDGWNWDWAACACLPTGYTPGERERLADVAVSRFRDRWGFAPRSVAGWYIDAHTLAYLAAQHGIIASANCKEQFGTDGYTLWGGPFTGGYYPSRRNALCPGHSPADQLPLPVFRMLGADPIHQYDCGLGASAQGVVSLEPVYREGGGSQRWVTWFLDLITRAPCLAFAHTQTGQENSFGWRGMKDGYALQVAELVHRRAAGELDVECLATSGEWFRERFPVTPAQAQVALTDGFGGPRRSIWYHSRFYRANLLLDGESLALRDLHRFDPRYPEPLLTAAGPGRAMRVDTLPVVDGFRWSDREHRARAEWATVTPGAAPTPLRAVGPVVVTEPAASQLQVTVPVGADRTLTITLAEETLTSTLSGLPAGAVLALVLHLPLGTPGTTLQPEADALAFTHEGFGYRLAVPGRVTAADQSLILTGSGATLSLCLTP